MWVPELGGKVQSANVIIDESVPGELETGVIHPEISENDKEKLLNKTYTRKGFEHLRGTTHVDNKDGLEVSDHRRQTLQE